MRNGIQEVPLAAKLLKVTPKAADLSLGQRVRNCPVIRETS